MNTTPRPTIERAMDRHVQLRRVIGLMVSDLQYFAHPAHSPLIAAILDDLHGRYMVYLQDGRGRDANGVRRSIQGVWKVAVRLYRPPPIDFSPTFPVGFDEGAP